MRRTEVPEEFRTVESPTEPQLKFINSLLDERDLRQGGKVVAATDEEYAEAIKLLKEQAKTLSVKSASGWIERLLTFPQLPRQRTVHRGGSDSTVPTPTELPAGHYAIENNDGELRFYRLWRGTRNPNYVKLYVSHGPDDSEVPFKSALTIMAKIIEAGPYDCARRYGAEIEHCCVCNTRLTNRVSRLLKIGPICGGRFWQDESTWKGLVSEARERIAEAGLDPAGNVEDDDDFDYNQELSCLI
jgi:hypothetical protein